MQSKYPQKPIAPDPMTEARWEHTSLRRQMLTGQWHDILVEEIERHVPTDRARAWGVPDMSSNIFKSATQALSVLYQEPPTIGVMNAMPNQADDLLSSDGLIDKAGLWPLMQRIQMFTIGLRECFLRVDINNDGTGLLYRVVTPDFVYAEAPAGDPSNPNLLEEYRLRLDEESNKYMWTIDSFDLRDSNNPKYEVYTINQNGERNENVTARFLGGVMSGSNYPYRDSSGKAFIPYTLYHAEVHGGLFDAFNGAENVAGALNGSVLYTYFLHLSRDCAHPQRWILGAGLAGLDMYDNNLSSRRNAIATDPASILVFSADPDLQPGQQPQIGQFQAGGDVEKTLAAIHAYERKIASNSGINPSDLQKGSSDPRSGYAISLSRSGLREAQRKFRPAFSRGDVRTLELSAMISNIYLNTNFPESGYRIEYHAIELSPEEQKAQREQLLQLVAAGLMSKVEAIQVLHPDLDEEEAIQKLETIRRQNIEFS